MFLRIEESVLRTVLVITCRSVLIQGFFGCFFSFELFIKLLCSLPEFAVETNDLLMPHALKYKWTSKGHLFFHYLRPAYGLQNVLTEINRKRYRFYVNRSLVFRCHGRPWGSTPTYSLVAYLQQLNYTRDIAFVRATETFFFKI